MSSAVSPAAQPMSSGNVNIVAIRKKSDNAAMDVAASNAAIAVASAAPPSGPGTADSPPPPSSSSKKPHLKEKITQMYECLTRGDDTDRHPTFGDNFWSEFFLLRPKISVLEAEIGKVGAEALAANAGGARSNLNRLFAECVDNLSNDHHIRVVYALQTLCGLVRAVMSAVGKKGVKGGGGTGMGGELVGLLVGMEKAEQTILELISHLNQFLMGDEPASLKDLCLKLLLVMSTGVDNVSQNALLDFLMMSSVYESLIHLLSRSESRLKHGHSAVLLLAVLVQFRKNESTNPYKLKLSILDVELALHGFGQVITHSLATYTQAFEASCSDNSSSGWFSSFTSMVGNMFVSEEGSPRVEQMKARNSVLLAFYEAVHLNRNFIATLGHYQTDTESSPRPVSRMASVAPPTSSSAATTPVGTHPPNLGSPQVSVVSSNGDHAAAMEASPQSAALATTTTSAATVPSNLLVTFLEYLSIIMQDTKTESSVSTIKLSFLVLLCVTEDQYANALMHDPNLVFRVRLHRAPMRHRKVIPNWELDARSQPLSCAVLDLMVEFIRSHMMKRLPHELYLHALSVIHRLLAYQKRSRVRLGYAWKELWSALIALAKFVASNESSLVKKMNIFAIGHQIVVIFNLFVTYGDTFLPSPSSYDELYYELVRCSSVFDSMYSMALRYHTGGGEHKETAGKLMHSLANVRTITAHFGPKIEAWLAANQLSTPSEEQILEVVKANYDSLTLKLQDGLDQYERYVEYPRHSDFFTSIVRGVVTDTRHTVVLNDLELQAVLQDFSTIQ